MTRQEAEEQKIKAIFGKCKKSYLVTLKIVLSREVEANSKREAEETARDMGEYNADISRVTDWTAKPIQS